MNTEELISVQGIVEDLSKSSDNRKKQLGNTNKTNFSGIDVVTWFL